jgi:predicted methyltransferase
VLNFCLLFVMLPGAVAAATDKDILTAVIESRNAADRVRDDARHPLETLTFFQVEPGMTVAEVLPGSGWYSRILALYLGSRGALYGVNYTDSMWELFDRGDAWAAERRADTRKFVEKVHSYVDDVLKISGEEIGEVSKEVATTVDHTRAIAPGLLDDIDTGIEARGFTFGTIPAEIAGTVDRVLMIRALHNLNRFEPIAGTRTQALAAVRGMLKEDGLVGVVQHRLPESAADEGADGGRGYLKQSAVIDMFEQAGFKLVASSEINANPKDQPGAGDIVWRLPPSLSTSEENPALRAAMEAIGESDRMTLLFRKAD